jgi:hypothetical protein
VGDECGTSRVSGRSHALVGVILAALKANLWTLVIHREQLMMDRCAVALLPFFMLSKLGKPVFFVGFLIHHTNILQSCCSYHTKKIDECST